MLAMDKQRLLNLLGREKKKKKKIEKLNKKFNEQKKTENKMKRKCEIYEKKIEKKNGSKVKILPNKLIFASDEPSLLDALQT